MTKMISRLFALQLATDSRVATIGSMIMYAGATAFCVFACREMYDLGLSGMRITFGLLLIVCTAMLMVVGGMLLSVLGRLSDARK